jgi:hypothetical protein
MQRQSGATPRHPSHSSPRRLQALPQSAQKKYEHLRRI